MRGMGLIWWGSFKKLVILIVLAAGCLAAGGRLIPFFVPGPMFWWAMVPGREEICYEGDLPAAGEGMLRRCFGDDYELGEGEEKEYEYYDYHDQVYVRVRYREWTLSYRDIWGEERVFVFDNRGAGSDEGKMESSIKEYFRDLTEEFYRGRFWDEAAAGIGGLREDSVMYVQAYHLFSSPRVPETSVMFDERVQYCLAEHIYFPELRFQEVFEKFPYIMDLYLYVTYESGDEGERERQRKETEERLRQMVDGMIAYTGGTLNAAVSVTMMDEDGFADGFGFSVLKGEYFENEGDGEYEYEIRLHENFFGPIELEEGT
ncbi:MAG: hypothetical protein HFG69_04375 [Hungatella sp.]|nr:hypothetical protein [Hungatella sp.]